MDSKLWRIYIGRAALVVAGPLAFFATLEGALFLTGKFEPVRVLERVRHQGKEYWTTVPARGSTKKGLALLSKLEAAFLRRDAPRTEDR